MSNLTPLVSVVMPTYNRADLLPKTVESILSQGFDDLELLIVDDGSTDNTAQVIAQLQGQDLRLRYVKLFKNQGIGFARDAGLQNVSGKYIGLADSDDPWLPGKLKLQVEVMEAHPEIDILFSDWRNINHRDGTQINGFVATQVGLRHLITLYLADDLWLIESGVETGILKSNFVQPATMFLKAEIFEKVGGFKTTLSTPVDLEFGWRAAVLGAKYAYINQPLIERHVYESSVTTRTIDAAIQKIKALEGLYQICETAHRPDLLNEVRTAEDRTWRKLIWAYGRKGQRIEAIRTFWRSLQCGLTGHRVLFLATALLGPQAISVAAKVRMSA